MANLTIVTGIWNIGRSDINTCFKRSFEDHYLIHINNLLYHLHDYNVIIYIEERYVKQININSVNHKIYIKELDWFKTNFELYNEVQSIRIDKTWLAQAYWIKDSPHSLLNLYNPVVFSKYFLLNDSIKLNPFGTDYFIWIDGGITNTLNGSYFSHDKTLEKITPYLETFLFLSFPYENDNEIHGFNSRKMAEFCKIDKVKYVCRGGFFGGHKKIIGKYDKLYQEILKSTISQGYMGTEECIFTIMSYLKPSIFKRFMIDSNGLINIFFEHLKHNDIKLL